MSMGEIQAAIAGAYLLLTSQTSITAFPLTPSLSHREREHAGLSLHDNNSAIFATWRTVIRPLPEGEGRGEGKARERPHKPFNTLFASVNDTMPSEIPGKLTI